MGSTADIDKDNIILATAEHLSEDVRQQLEERKKKRDEEDLKAALASIKVHRRGRLTKIKEIDFTSTSTSASVETISNVSNAPTGVSIEQIENMFAERDVRLVNMFTDKLLTLVGKQLVIDDISPDSIVETTEVPISQLSVTLPTSQPPYGMPMLYFNGQTVTPTNALVAQQTYSDPLTSIHSSTNFRRTYELENSKPPYSTHT